MPSDTKTAISGITLRPCLVHLPYISEPPTSPSYYMNFFYLSALLINKVETNQAKFHRSLVAETGALGGSYTQGCNPWSQSGFFMVQKMVITSPIPAFERFKLCHACKKQR